MKIKILVIDDDKSNLPLLKEILSDVGFQVFIESDSKKVLPILKKKKIDIILTDIMMPDIDGREIIKKAKKLFPPISAFAFSAFRKPEIIVEAIKCGANDFIEKPFDVPALVKSLKIEAESILHRKKIETEAEKPIYFMGSSTSVKSIRKQKMIAAENVFNVLITGETGTGKELVARGIHERSARSDGPFVAVNCASIPESLIESELFGFEKGAFSGANRKFRGKCEQANRGTLFLDEIGDMPVLLQTRLLRFLQEKEVTPLGKEVTIKTDVRIIAATHCNLGELTAKAQFREDLYHRLNVFPISITPLRKRPEDVKELASFFFKEINNKSRKKKKRISADSISRIMKYPFPGNARELKNIIERSFAVSSGPEVELIFNLDDKESGFIEEPDDKCVPLDVVIFNYCRSTLEAEGSNIKKTAETLGISRNRLKRILNTL